MNVLRTRLLGVFSLVYGDQPVTTVNISRLQSPLARPLLHRQAPPPRRHLASLLQPASATAQACTHLHTRYHRQRIYADQHRGASPRKGCHL